VIFVPFDFAFTTKKHIIMEIAETIIDVLFILDIVITFRTMYFSNRTGEKIADSKKIAKNYVFRGRFIFDVLSAIPVDLLNLSSKQNKYFYIAKFLKLTRLFRLGKIVSFLRYKATIKSSLKIFLIICFLLL
jgi:potassium voltage-gated channel Eag-related subfamily H protein 7